LALADQPDDELVRRANAGERDAFEALYVRYRDWLLRGAFAVTCREDLAQECVQRVVLYWLGKFPGFQLRGRMTSFLYPVVRHTALELLRTERRGNAADVESLTHASQQPAESDAVQAALDRLTPEKREVVHLVIVEGLTLAHAAEAIGIPVGTAKTRLHHAVKELEADPALRRAVFGLDS
jgi:RNA polymerase sigma-70 factor (ECF subfamily)